MKIITLDPNSKPGSLVFQVSTSSILTDLGYKSACVSEHNSTCGMHIQFK